MTPDEARRAAFWEVKMAAQRNKQRLAECVVGPPEPGAERPSGPPGSGSAAPFSHGKPLVCEVGIGDSPPL